MTGEGLLILSHGDKCKKAHVMYFYFEGMKPIRSKRHFLLTNCPSITLSWSWVLTRCCVIG